MIVRVKRTVVTVTYNSPFQDYPHPDDHTTRSTVAPGFKPFTVYFGFFSFFLSFLVVSFVPIDKNHGGIKSARADFLFCLKDNEN